MILINSLESAFKYAARLGLAGKDCIHNQQQRLKYYSDEMLKASGQASWPCIPMIVHYNRKSNGFTATCLGPGCDQKMLRALQRVVKLRKSRAEQKKVKA